MAIQTGLGGRTVLITGAGRNIGRLAALAYAREGANLALCTRANMEPLERVAEEARALGARVVTRQCDVSDAQAVGAFVQAARAELGTVDVAINNAVYRSANDASALLEQPPEVWRRNVEVNLEGPYNVCRAVLPLMQARGWGRIINFTGATAYLGVGVAKAAVRLGVVGLTRGIAREFGAHNITANCVGPSTVETHRDASAPRKGVRATQPIQRLAKPEEIVALLLYLSSENAGFITGQSYLVNGGNYFL
jgi:3-oxoacyl-[acyl-carrier protein] reductase